MPWRKGACGCFSPVRSGIEWCPSVRTRCPPWTLVGVARWPSPCCARGRAPSVRHPLCETSLVGRAALALRAARAFGEPGRVARFVSNGMSSWGLLASIFLTIDSRCVLCTALLRGTALHDTSMGRVRPMNLAFNEKKATQAAASFLRLAGNELNYMVLIKDLYLVDRKALAAWGRSVTNDRYYSMKLGPVLIHVLDLIHDQPSPSDSNYWAIHISPPSNYKVTLNGDPGTGQLSPVEEELIATTFREYEGYQDRPFDFSDHLHSCLPEWEPVTEGRSPISIRSILLAAHKEPDEINEIEDDLTHLNRVYSLLGVRDV